MPKKRLRQFRIHFSQAVRVRSWGEVNVDFHGDSKVFEARDDTEAANLATNFPFRVNKLERIISPARAEVTKDLTSLIKKEE